MKKVECIVRPEKLEELIQGFEELGINGLNITQITGYGEQKGATKIYRGVKYEVKLKEKLKIEIVISDDKVEELIDTIVKTARTGEVGDGKIFIYDIEEAIKIRTGETGQDAV
ncbi:P-II family nitrogen regulator [Natroniella sulfidigena]|uniref:P-II family nitrogen regulator n=1 Tax=Natroniella sulfidigena TaxID=723921 RepID=UPI00200AD483|nr:P-II family nitrogen regulator [Natroniella sulfidigena]MCK8817974.1 P-II family nitrogen regulator [Natroniella sulfidigena]